MLQTIYSIHVHIVDNLARLLEIATSRKPCTIPYSKHERRVAESSLFSPSFRSVIALYISQTGPAARGLAYHSPWAELHALTGLYLQWRYFGYVVGVKREDEIKSN